MEERQAQRPSSERDGSASPLVEASNVSKRFGATLALDRVSVAVNQGESRALVGRNGAGKSTLVSILTGLVRADSGELRFAGRPAPRPEDRDAWQQRVACVYQKSTLFPHLTVAENLFINAHPQGRFGAVGWRRMRMQAAGILDEWNIAVSPTAEAGHLRVEDRQLVEIARALASGSRFLILDEPTARLEHAAIQRLFRRLANLRDAGVSILYISHHLDEIYDVCDTVTVLRDGRAVQAADVSDMPKSDLVAAMVGEHRDGASASNGGSARRGRPALTRVGREGLRVKNLAVDDACDGVSFEVRRGEFVGLAGLAGSGKAQIAEAIAGLRRPTTGEIHVGGRRVPPGDVAQAIACGVGFVPQDRHSDGFAPNLSVEENITLSSLGALGPLGFVSPRTRRRLAKAFTDSLGVVASGPAQAMAELSGGNQQKVVVGRALVPGPHALVVVNPTAGVDVASKEALFETITALEDVAVLVVSDELDELSHCDRVLVMFAGRLTNEFETWTERELVAAVEGVEEE